MVDYYQQVNRETGKVTRVVWGLPGGAVSYSPESRGFYLGDKDFRLVNPEDVAREIDRLNQQGVAGLRELHRARRFN